MPYFNDPDYSKQYVGKTIRAIVSQGQGRVCFQFEDGTAMDMFAHQMAPKHVEGDMYRHPSPTIIVNRVVCGLNLPGAVAVVGTQGWSPPDAKQAEDRVARLPHPELAYKAVMGRSEQLKKEEA